MNNGINDQTKEIQAMLDKVQGLNIGELMKPKLLELSLPVVVAKTYDPNEPEARWDVQPGQDFTVEQTSFFIIPTDKIRLHDTKPYPIYSENGEWFLIEMSYDMLRKKYKALYA